MKQRLKTMITLLGLSIGFVMFGAAQAAQAATYTVDTTDRGANLSWSSVLPLNDSADGLFVKWDKFNV
jgi:polyisoprenoid-binding protein YceI